MLTAKQREILEVLYNGQVPDHHKDHIHELLEGAYVVENDGRYKLTDAGRNELHLAKGFGEAVADAFLPGAGSSAALRTKK